MAACWFTSGKTVGARHILPVAIFDRSGKDVTPAGLRWSLRKAASGWLLELKLNDAKLPLPYVIDPGLTGVSATATSLAAGAKAHWTIGFTTGTGTGALAAAGTITVNYGTWTGGSFPANPVIELLTPDRLRHDLHGNRP